MVIGVIGKVGSGKSAAVEFIEREYKAIVFSCDEIAKDIIEKKETDYVALPPGMFFRSDEAQEECRSKIHKRVFDRINQSIKNILNKNNFNNANQANTNNIVNNENFETNISKIENKNNFQEYLRTKKDKTNFPELFVIECALPGEKLFEMCDKIIYIKNSYEDKVRLLYEKRGYTEDVTKLIYDSQAYYDKFYDRADITIINDGTKADLEKKVKEVVDEIYIIRK